ncbi:unnamed protein product [Lampetra planeri]
MRVDVHVQHRDPHAPWLASPRWKNSARLTLESPATTTVIQRRNPSPFWWPSSGEASCVRRRIAPLVAALARMGAHTST